MIHSLPPAIADKPHRVRLLAFVLDEKRSHEKEGFDWTGQQDPKRLHRVRRTRRRLQGRVESPRRWSMHHS